LLEIVIATDVFSSRCLDKVRVFLLMQVDHLDRRFKNISKNNVFVYDQKKKMTKQSQVVLACIVCLCYVDC